MQIKSDNKFQRLFKKNLKVVLILQLDATPLSFIIVQFGLLEFA